MALQKWVEGWQANSWMKRDKTEVLNRGLWEELIVVTAGKNIAWKHVAGHSGVIGNERADYIATSFAEGKTPNLFRGSITEYGFDILDVSYDEKMKSARSKTRARSRAKAYSYLSLVGGIFSRHSTWAECEACVKGSKGAKYRKAISIEDEAIIKKSGEFRAHKFGALLRCFIKNVIHLIAIRFNPFFIHALNCPQICGL